MIPNFHRALQRHGYGTRIGMMITDKTLSANNEASATFLQRLMVKTFSSQLTDKTLSLKRHLTGEKTPNNMNPSYINRSEVYSSQQNHINAIRSNKSSSSQRHRPQNDRSAKDVNKSELRTILQQIATAVAGN